MPEISGMIQQFLEGNIKTLSAEPVIESKTITENGTYTAPEGVDGYSPVVVNVEPVIESKTITENGTYTPESGVDGFAPVVVNVPSDEPVIESKNISENGTYTAPEGVDGYSPVVVSVPEKTLTTKSITANGTYNASDDNADGYSSVSVNVPLPSNAYLLKSVTTPTPIASFSDGEEMVMPSLKVAIEPQQEGSGDPSPENIRPISGWSECNMSVSGVNLFDINSCENGYLNESGVFLPYSGFYCTPYLNIKPNITYSLAYNRINISSGNGMRIAWYDKNKTFIRRDGDAESGTNGKKIITATAPSNAHYCRCSLVDSQEKYMFVIGTITDLSSYTPYTGSHTNTIDLDGTRYGGTLDVINGIGREYKEYPSYNGETLIGPWISDRDVYVPNTSPTIGAQVVDMGDTSTFNSQPTSIKSLDGENNIWVDTGDITDAEYFSKED